MMTKHEKIRCIASSHSGNRFAVAEFKNKIQLWDIEDGLVNVFNTDFDFGGNRLAISVCGKLMAVGSYTRDTIALYSVDSNRLVWTRRDLKGCQSIRFTYSTPSYLIITSDKSQLQMVSIEDGKTISILSDVRDFWPNPSGAPNILEKPTNLHLVGSDFQFMNLVDKNAFALLDVCFTANCAFMSYAGGPIEVVELSNAKSKSVIQDTGHFLKIGFNKKAGKLLGIKWDYINGGSKVLCLIDVDRGEIEFQIDLGDMVTSAFMRENEFLVTSRGELISVASLSMVKKFDFESN